MKKKFFVVGATAILALVNFIVSCSKDKEWKGCTCSIIWDDGERY